ncbi:GEM-like protein 2 [Rhodamnia argentea]|uniref:GEM-like protein 2 n=1 Tax=Rhodamnia argentea TaxID=178133 RepID=A0A8B8QV54_9MYRT|nr:GEM-like protein 2 [Rhodamnia argentea]
MSGRGESASAHCGTGVVGKPVERQEDPASEHATTLVASEARPASSSAPGVVSANKSSENPYLQLASMLSSFNVGPVNASGKSGWNPMNKVSKTLKKVDDAKRNAEALADNVWHHLKTSNSITDAAIARLAQGKKMLSEGGRDKIFERNFDIQVGEKLLKAYACYLSTSSGRVIGTLYLSSKRLVFSGDEPIYKCSPSGQEEWVYYKVVLQLDQLSFVCASSKESDPSEKYIQVVTRDGYEFWFMSFVSYEKALKNIHEALQHNREINMAGRTQERSVAREGK